MDDLDPTLREEAYALQAHLGFDLTGWRADWARVELPVGPHLGNRQGLVHGGVHATLLDTAMGYCGCYTGDRDRRMMALTLSLTVNYLSQVKGLRLIAEANRTGGGRSTFFASATLSDDTARISRLQRGCFATGDPTDRVLALDALRAMPFAWRVQPPKAGQIMAGPRRHWREMTTRDFSDADTGDWIAILPIAAIEQHGPHLPVGVDALIADAMVTRCAAALPEGSPATFLPVQQVCKSNEHIAFPGTLTLDWETAIRSWLQIGESVARAGLRKMIIVTSHGGNVAPMEIVARELRQTHGMAVATTAWTRLTGARVYSYPEGPMVDIHGGLSETSMMLALYPDLVRTDLVEDFASAQTALRQGSAKLGFHMADANLGWLSQDLNPKGTVGDAASATAALGAADIESQVDGFVALVDDMARHEPPEPSCG